MGCTPHLLAKMDLEVKVWEEQDFIWPELSSDLLTPSSLSALVMYLPYPKKGEVEIP